MVPGLVMANGNDLEEEDEGEEMYVDSLGQALDLFSPKTFPTAEECMEHCRYNTVKNYQARNLEDALVL